MKSRSPHGGGGGFRGARGDWVRLAQRALLELVDEELAVAHPELEARLGEQGVRYGTGTEPVRIHPHIITEAQRQLRNLHAIDEVNHVTKGGVAVPVLVPADRRRRETAVQRAVRRKGMLYNRFLLLSRTAGEAGESVVRRSLEAAGRHLIPITDGFGPVRSLMSVRLAGELDSGAWLHRVDPATHIPGRLIALPIEIKNRRLVLYPIHKEVHQLLAKAARVQLANPDYPITPVLVCRRAHPWLFWMAADLGFLVTATRRQFVRLPAKMGPRLFEEVRTELRLTDLTLAAPAPPAQPPMIREFFQQVLPREAAKQAPRWAAVAATVEPYAAALAKDNLTPAQRTETIRDLRDTAEAGLHAAGYTDRLKSWSIPHDEDHGEDDEPI